MIFSQLQKDVAAVPNADAYFSQTLASGRKRCTALWQGQQEDLNKGALETAKAAQEALNSEGVTCIVNEPEITAGEGGIMASAAISLFFCENVFQNRSDNGTKNTAYEFAVKALALLIGKQLGPWGPLMFDGLTSAEVNREGYLAWELTFRTQTMVDTLVYLLANQFGQPLMSDSGQLRIVSPTPA